jgi:hypothetical protein
MTMATGQDNADAAAGVTIGNRVGGVRACRPGRVGKSALAVRVAHQLTMDAAIPQADSPLPARVDTTARA